MADLLKEEKIAKLDSLINQGRSLLENKSYEEPGWSLDQWTKRDPQIVTYTEVNADLYPGWRMESLANLKSFLGSNSTYVKEFERNCRAVSNESNLRQGLGILEAVKKGYSENTLLEESHTNLLKPETMSNKRITISNLPKKIALLVDELNDNLIRNNFNASALLIRKIVTLSCFVSLDKIGKSSGFEGRELNEMLAATQKELKISDRVMSKVRSAKWLADSANHSYKIAINESDVEVAATGLRIFLGEIF